MCALFRWRFASTNLNAFIFQTIWKNSSGLFLGSPFTYISLLRFFFINTFLFIHSFLHCKLFPKYGHDLFFSLLSTVFLFVFRWTSSFLILAVNRTIIIFQYLYSHYWNEFWEFKFPFHTCCWQNNNPIQILSKEYFRILEKWLHTSSILLFISACRPKSKLTSKHL